MIGVLLLVLTAVFPLLCYLVLKGIVRRDSRKGVRSPLAAELNAATAEFEAFVREKVAPVNPRLAAEMLREAASNRRALAELSSAGRLSYFLGRPRSKRSLEELVRTASSRYESLARTALEPRS
jgi:hypothetical protein